MRPFWEQDGNKIYQGHILNVLPALEPESVHLVVTSPPYWGLRDYGIEPEIWLPDSREWLMDYPEGCVHVWGDEASQSMVTPRTERENWNSTDEHAEGKARTGGVATINISQGQFCQLCGAWRGSLGLEPTPELYVKHIVEIFREVRRVLHKSGTVWLNLGSSYAGGGRGGKEGKASGGLEQNRTNKDCLWGPPTGKLEGFKPKDLIPIPWMVAMALQADGWYLRSAMPWVKRSAMPESVTDRPASALEYMFLLSKSQKYYFDMEAVKVKSGTNTHAQGKGIGKKVAPFGKGIRHNNSFSEATRNATKADLPATRNFRNTDLFYQSIEPPHGAIFYGDEMVGLDVNPQPFPGAHFATFPRKLVEPCILAGTSEKGYCPECLAPWERVVDYKANYAKREPAHMPRNTPSKVDSTGWKPPTIKQKGWKPGCKCDSPATHDCDRAQQGYPCTVMDIFGGSGTVALEAHKHGRDWILIEKNPDYVEMSIKRIEQETAQLKMFT